MDLASEQLPITLEDVHRFSLDEYHRLIESGGFDEISRVELIDGLIVDMSPKSSEHEQASEWFNDWLVLHRDRERYRVRTAGALTLERSEPEPDFAVIPRDAPAPYHPATAALVIEISLSSPRRDSTIKAVMYAKAGVPEYWVVDLKRRRIVCHRDPRPDGTYRHVTEIAEGDRLVAASIELPALDVRELMAAAYS
jgi:Uma2 family endonuclease